MPTLQEGHLVATGLRFGIVASRWNHFLSDRLVEGAMDALLRHGAEDANITLMRVPGCFEIPLGVQKLATSGQFDAVIGLGTLVRGATPHFDYISSEVTKGIAAVSLETGVPATYGIITADTLDQAIERAGTKAGNKGTEAALAAIEMADLFRRMDGHA